MTDAVERFSQVIRPTAVDHHLEPDAMRGSEQYLRGLKDADGNDVTVLDQEEERRQAQRNAAETRAPIRMVTPTTQTPAAEITPESVSRSPDYSATMVTPAYPTAPTPPATTSPAPQAQPSAPVPQNAPNSPESGYSGAPASSEGGTPAAGDAVNGDGFTATVV